MAPWVLIIAWQPHPVTLRLSLQIRKKNVYDSVLKFCFSFDSWPYWKNRKPQCWEAGFFSWRDWGVSPSRIQRKFCQSPPSTLVPVFGPRLVPPQPRFSPKIWKIWIHLANSKKWPNFALGGQFWLQSDFFISPPIRLRPHWGPMGTENFESPPHHKFREKNPERRNASKFCYPTLSLLNERSMSCPPKASPHLAPRPLCKLWRKNKTCSLEGKSHTHCHTVAKYLNWLPVHVSVFNRLDPLETVVNHVWHVGTSVLDSHCTIGGKHWFVCLATKESCGSRFLAPRPRNVP